MIKECEVIYRNEKVSVVKFDNKKIQIPNSDLIGRNVYIRFDKGTYTVVSKNEFEKENIKESIKVRTPKKKNDETMAMDNEE
jgi:hypothetical protein